jgi:hypothetical protein
MAGAVYVVYGIVSPIFGGLTGNLTGNAMICVICGAAGVIVYAAMILLLKVDLIMELLPKRESKKERYDDK